MVNNINHQFKFKIPDMRDRQIHELLWRTFGYPGEHYQYIIESGYSKWIHIDFYEEDMIAEAVIWINEIMDEPLTYGE
jgi:hypothetical protein